MKNLLLLIITVLIAFPIFSNPQRNLEIEQKGAVNYYYLTYKNAKLVFYAGSKLWPIQGEIVTGEFISDLIKRILSKGFKYDRKNDTVVIALSTNMLRVYNKDSLYKFYYYHDDYGRIKPAQFMLGLTMSECDKAIYEDNHVNVVKIVKDYGYHLTRGAGFAIRFIVKDDSIQYPISFWRYYSVE